MEQEVLTLSPIVTGDEATPDKYPHLYTISGRFLFRFLSVITEEVPLTEYVRVPLAVFEEARPSERNASLSRLGQCGKWNMAWEAGPLRQSMFVDELPSGLQWLSRYPDRNFCLVPADGPGKYAEVAALYHLLPAKLLRREGLPLLRRGLWPAGDEFTHPFLPTNYWPRLASALANHLWPFLVPRPGCPLSAFGANESFRLLAHNVDYWLPYLDRVIQRLRADAPRTTVNPEDLLDLALARTAPMEGCSVEPPLKGGTIWMGEEEAMDVTRLLVEEADKEGRLRAILDALQSHRVEDDFSTRWSTVKADFERSLYRKRSKVRVTFIELNETIPIHSADTEVHDDIFWQEFIALLDQKERHVLVLLRNGLTQSEISKNLGYANHSPVSKAIARIRDRAKRILDA